MCRCGWILPFDYYMPIAKKKMRVLLRSLPLHSDRYCVCFSDLYCPISSVHCTVDHNCQSRCWSFWHRSDFIIRQPCRVMKVLRCLFGEICLVLPIILVPVSLNVIRFNLFGLFPVGFSLYVLMRCDLVLLCSVLCDPNCSVLLMWIDVKYCAYVRVDLCVLIQVVS